MEKDQRKREVELVRQCLRGSEKAWDEFYNRYACLIRSVVRRKLRLLPQETEDIVQNVFADLIPALKTFDLNQPLTRFIAVIAERVCINHYHWSKAAKRDGHTTPIDHFDGAEEGAKMIPAGTESQEAFMIQEQRKEILRRAIWELSAECWKLIQLREFEGLPYKEISRLLGHKENTLIVKARRCLEELKEKARTLVRKGCKA